MNKIQFVDLKSQYDSLRNEIDAAIRETIDKSDFILGDGVAKFEREFAEYVGTKYAVAVANGTDSLELALRVYINQGTLKIGDTVAIPANTFIADAYAIVAAGLKIRLVDVEEDTFLISASELGKVIAEVDAVIGVSLYGQTVGANVRNLCEMTNKVYIQDASQSHGAKAAGWDKSCMSCWSLYPGKNLGAMGDAGIITLDDEAQYRELLKLRNYGSSQKYIHDSIGRNSRMDTLQARILSCKLKKLDKWNDDRIWKAHLYNTLLEGVGDIKTPFIISGKKHVFHIYCIQTKQRDELQKHLSANGIPTVIHYPTPIHQQLAFKDYDFGSDNSFPVTETLSKEILSLPMHPFLTSQEVEFISQTIEKFYNGQTS